MHHFIQRALLKNSEYNEVEAQKLAEEDWNSDAKGPQQEYISEKTLYTSIFQIVDLWVFTVEKAHYVEFLRKLKKRVEKLMLRSPKRRKAATTRWPRDTPDQRAIWEATVKRDTKKDSGVDRRRSIVIEGAAAIPAEYMYQFNSLKSKALSPKSAKSDAEYRKFEAEMRLAWSDHNDFIMSPKAQSQSVTSAAADRWNVGREPHGVDNQQEQ
jgi:hypothetical protein